MGWTYSYDIICKREQLWELLKTVAQANPSVTPGIREQDVMLRVKGRELQVPFETLWGKELVFQDLPIKEISFHTALAFALDEPLTQYYGVLPQDEQGRVSLGFRVSVTTQEEWLDEEEEENSIHYEYIDATDVRLQFRASSSRTSFGFETSASLRQTFVRLARSQQNTICLFAREDNGVLLWLEDRELIEEVEEPWLTREAFRKQVRSNVIARELQARAGEVFPTDLFAQGMMNPEALVRVVAIRKLANSSYVNRDLLAQVLLEDPVAEVRCRAAEALGNFPTLSYSSAVPALIKAALEDSYTEVRVAACRALRRESRNEVVVETLFTLLKESAKELRWAAAGALSSLAQERHIPALVEALTDEVVVGQIATALGRLRALEAVDVLCQLLERSQWSDKYPIQLQYRLGRDGPSRDWRSTGRGAPDSSAGKR